MVGARRLARPRLPDSESGGSAIPRKPRAGKNGAPDRLRSGDLLHERQACWLDYTTGIKDGAGERRRTVVSALARPHSAVEPHPLTKWRLQNAQGSFIPSVRYSSRKISISAIGLKVFEPLAGLFHQLSPGAF